MTDRNGTPIATIFDQYRLPLRADQVPGTLKVAIVSVEDRRFCTEHGIDPAAVVRALLNDVVGGPTEGGSTITQQLVKNYLIDVVDRHDPAAQQADRAARGHADGRARQGHDDGTSSAAARDAGWTRPGIGKTGTTQTSESVAFVGGVDGYAVSSLVFADGAAPGELCPGPPVHLGDCGHGAFGGTVAAPPYFAAMSSILAGRADQPVPDPDPRYAGQPHTEPAESPPRQFDHDACHEADRLDDRCRGVARGVRAASSGGR